MRLLGFFGLLATIVARVHSQSSSLEALEKALPACALKCMIELIPQSSCSLTNQTCICTNEDLSAATTLCVAANCTITESLTTKNVSETACGAPIRDLRHTFSTIGVAGYVVAFVAFVIRIAATLPCSGRPMGMDDWTMCLLVLLALPPAVFSVFLARNGLGKDIWTLKPANITKILQLYYYGEIFYMLALATSKVSILCFFLRVFPSEGFRKAVWVVMGFCVAYGIIFAIVTAAQCRPVSYAWHQWDGEHEGKCNNIHLQGWLAAGFNILLDTAVMILPLRHLSQLNMSLRKKIMIMLMFSVGIFVIAVSIVRLESLVHFANSQNVTWDYVPAGYWSLIEIYVSIICACMPAHRYLILKIWPRLLATLRSYHTSSSSTKVSNGTEYVQTIVKQNKLDDMDSVPLVDIENHNSQTHSQDNRPVTAHSGQTKSTGRPDSWTIGNHSGQHNI